jgi:thioredoxin 1
MTKNQKNSNNKPSEQKDSMKRNLFIGIAAILVIVLILVKAEVLSGRDSGGMEIELTDTNFEELVMSEDQLVMVDFWAVWCGPCRMTAPVVKQLAEQYAGKIVVGKVNVDENPQLSERFQIMSIPTLLFFKNGKIVDQQVGYVPKELLEQQINKLIQ